MASLTNSEVLTRLTHLMSILNVNKKTFAKTINIHYTKIANCFRKTNETPVSIEILKIVSTYFRINLDYFQTDTIPMRSLVVEDGFFKTKTKPGVCSMRLLSTTVSANFDTCLTEQSSLFEDFGVSQAIYERYSDNSILARVEGKSMLPAIPHNAIVVITKIPNWKEIEHQTIAIAYDGIFTIKKIKKNDYENGFLMLYPENPDYSAKKVDVKEIHEVFKVERIIDAEIE